MMLSNTDYISSSGVCSFYQPLCNSGILREAVFCASVGLLPGEVQPVGAHNALGMGAFQQSNLLESGYGCFSTK